MTTLFNVVSADGFIARPDGSEDFIPDDLWPVTLELFKRYDTLVMGRRTYDALRRYPAELLEPFDALPLKKIIVTRDRTFLPAKGYVVAHSPKDAVASGNNVLLSSGPELNGACLEEGLIEQVIFHRLGDAIGSGIRPLSAREFEKLVPISKTTVREGVTEERFRVARTAL
jgi:dihydrofolate reductase